jgi:hypothetical protein
VLGFCEAPTLARLRAVNREQKTVVDAHSIHVFRRLAALPIKAKAVELFESIGLNPAEKRALNQGDEARGIAPISSRRYARATDVIYALGRSLGYPQMAAILDRRDARNQRRVRKREREEEAEARCKGFANVDYDAADCHRQDDQHVAATHCKRADGNHPDEVVKLHEGLARRCFDPLLIAWRWRQWGLRSRLRKYDAGIAGGGHVRPPCKPARPVADDSGGNQCGDCEDQPHHGHDVIAVHALPRAWGRDLPLVDESACLGVLVCFLEPAIDARHRVWSREANGSDGGGGGRGDSALLPSPSKLSALVLTHGQMR